MTRSILHLHKLWFKKEFRYTVKYCGQPEYDSWTGDLDTFETFLTSIEKFLTLFSLKFFNCTVKFCGLFPVQLPNHLGARPLPKKKSLSNSYFFYFQIKIFCHFWEIFPPGPGSRRKFILINKDFSSWAPAPKLFGSWTGDRPQNFTEIRLCLAVTKIIISVLARYRSRCA